MGLKFSSYCCSCCCCCWPCWCFVSMDGQLLHVSACPCVDVTKKYTTNVQTTWKKTRKKEPVPRQQQAACAEREEWKKERKRSSARSSGSRTNKKRNDNEKQTLKIGFFICIGKSNQANVKTSDQTTHAQHKAAASQPGGLPGSPIQSSSVPASPVQTCGSLCMCVLRIRQVCWHGRGVYKANNKWKLCAACLAV